MGLELNRMTGKAAQLAGRAVDFVLPPRCHACGELVDASGRLCARCWSDLNFITPPHCALCGFPFEYDQGEGATCGSCLRRAPPFEAARSALRYDDMSRDLVLKFKRSDRTDMAAVFAPLLMRAVRATGMEFDLVVPVPLHRRRLWRRRFNQSALLARPLAAELGLDLDLLTLTRRRATPTQAGLAGRQRFLNVRGAFAVPARRRARLAERSILLIDDVFTTGATLSACARALKRAGARAVGAVTVARVVHPMDDPI